MRSVQNDSAHIAQESNGLAAIVTVGTERVDALVGRRTGDQHAGFPAFGGLSGSLPGRVIPAGEEATAARLGEMADRRRSQLQIRGRGGKQAEPSHREDAEQVSMRDDRRHRAVG
jgi:hypothetical protein